MSSELDVWYDAEESFSNSKDSFSQEDSRLVDNLSQIVKETLAEGEETTNLLERLIQMRIGYQEHLNTGGRARPEWIPINSNESSTDPDVIEEDELRRNLHDTKHVFLSLVGACRDAHRAIEAGREQNNLLHSVDNAHFSVTFLTERLNEIDDEIEQIEVAERRERRMIRAPERPSKIASLWETIMREIIGN